MTTDASKISFPLQLVIMIVGAFLAATGAIWANQARNTQEFSKLGSDVRDILTRMESERRVTDANAKLQESNNAAMNKAIEANAKAMAESIAAISRRQELQQLQIGELKESIISLTQARR